MPIYVEKELLDLIHKALIQASDEEETTEEKLNLVKKVHNIHEKILRIAKHLDFKSEYFSRISDEVIQYTTRYSPPTAISEKRALTVLGKEKKIEQASLEFLERIWRDFRKERKIGKKERKLENTLISHLNRIKKDVELLEKQPTPTLKQQILADIKHCYSYEEHLREIEFAAKHIAPSLGSDIHQLENMFRILLSKMAKLNPELDKITDDLSKTTPRFSPHRMETKIEQKQIRIDMKKALRNLKIEEKLIEEIEEDIKYIIRNLKLLYRAVENLYEMQTSMFEFTKSLFSELKKMYSLASRLPANKTFKNALSNF